MSVPSDDGDEISDQLWSSGSTGVAQELVDGSTRLISGFETKSQALAAKSLFGRFDPVCTAASTQWDGPAQTTHHVGEHAITIDAGQAFGHGHHPTTALLLSWLQDIDMVGRSVLDVGTGTGVLAIAACRLGAVNVTGIDNDPAAIESASLNMANNETTFALSDEPLAVHAEPADIVVANMLLPHQLGVAADVVRLTSSTLLVAGIIDSQVEELVAALSPLVLRETRSDGDWRALRLERNEGNR